MDGYDLAAGDYEDVIWQRRVLRRASELACPQVKASAYNHSTSVRPGRDRVKGMRQIRSTGVQASPNIGGHHRRNLSAISARSGNGACLVSLSQLYISISNGRKGLAGGRFASATRHCPAESATEQTEETYSACWSVCPGVVCLDIERIWTELGALEPWPWLTRRHLRTY